eukprot:s4572_g3.t1
MNMVSGFHLPLEAWKDQKVPMDKALPRYRPDAPPEEIPSQAVRPELALCQWVDGKLILPRDIRQQFLCDPIWGGEWRSILSSYDKDWGCHAVQQPTVVDVPQSEPTGPTFMPNEPTTLAALKEKYGDPTAELPIPDTHAVLLVMNGPMLFVGAKEATTLKPDGPIISHGAGSWLTAEKAVKFETDNPKKGIPCKFENDGAKENGSDSNVMTLRAALQKVWRLRTYTPEKCVAPAKPLWFLSGSLELPKDECRRIL